MTHSTEDKPSTPRTLEPSDPDLTPSTPRTLEPSAPNITIHSFCKPEEIQRCTFDGQFGMHAQYKSLYTKKESLEKNSTQKNANVTLALEGENIIGFGVLNHPDEGDRWRELGPGLMMEVKAIEICRRYRSHGIASRILGSLVHSSIAEKLIIFMVGYSWTWDLDGTGKSALDYRKMLIRLFEPFGLQELQTNEPNICLKSENLFMARVGQQVSTERQQEFKWLRFGVTP
jgi:acetoin utilization protein AcuA